MSSVLGGCFDSVVEVLVRNVFSENVPCADEYLTRDGYLYFHLILLADLCLVIGKTVEETILDSLAPHEHWMMVRRRYRLPCVTRRDLKVPFDWSLRGFSPLHEVRWPTVSKCVMSVPISAISDVAALIPTPGMV